MAKKAVEGGNAVAGENTIYKVKLYGVCDDQEGPEADYNFRRRIGMFCTGLRVMAMTNHFFLLKNSQV
jgi:hypothetical protein